MSATRFVFLLATVAVAAVQPACGRYCVPEQLTDSRRLIDLCADPRAHEPASSDVTREVAAEFRRRAMGQHPPGARPYHFLALSSGGLYGAYGAGVLKGWTDSGTRPPFDVVTGISTGALISTFAFLGPHYDDFLLDSMVGKKRREFLRLRRLVTIPVGGSLFSSRPLGQQIEKAITPRVLKEVAEAHAQGRRLYIGTTNLDSRKLILWDMGAIASRCTQESLALYRDIVLASSSIPGAFPAVRLKIDIDGVHYEELHVDGAASDGVIFRAFMVGDLNRAAGVPGLSAPPGSMLHIINNGKLYAKAGCVRRGLFRAMSSAVNSLLYNKTRDELYRIYLNTLETGVEFRLTSVPQDLPIASSSLNVTVEDQELLAKTGYQAGLRAGSGEGWRDVPPGSNPTEQALPRAGTHFATRPDGGPAPAGPQPPCASGVPTLLPAPPAVQGIPVAPGPGK